MPQPITPQSFVSKWKHADLTERASSQSHFIDLCTLLGQPSPTDADPTGESYAFEKGVSKSIGGEGWADVWKRGFFAWEYKRKGANLEKAYQQLQQYAEALENPPLLVVSDERVIQVHTRFTGMVKQVYEFTLEDLLDPKKLDRLRNVWVNPEAFRVPQTAASVTEIAAAEFGHIAEMLRAQGVEPRRAAHFLIRLLFCLFAEDTQLLPGGIFGRLVDTTRNRPEAFAAQLRQLFAAMRAGGYFGVDEIPRFNGGLFDDDDVVPLDGDALHILANLYKLDWSSTEPAILGTLFERSLDPTKRSQLGAHYTSRDDILLIVEPVLMAPLRRRWVEIQVEARALAARRDEAKGGQHTKLSRELEELLRGFAQEIASVRVLDAACGSGNFLYVALKLLLDLEKEIVVFASELGLTRFFPSVSPAQLHGIEINEYAHQLAQATIWIGYIQWLRDNGFGAPSEPILKPIESIIQMDAILGHDAEGRPVEPEWPQADVIIGNPPFLGGNKIRQELGDVYVDRLFELYQGRVPATADLVCYWFERARVLIEIDQAKRAGLLATNSIRGGANRKVLERIKSTGDIFMAWGDRDWILEGAAVNVSMVGFDDGSELIRSLDGRLVPTINPDLTAGLDLVLAKRLMENIGICFRSDEKGGAFDIDGARARAMLKAIGNPNRRPNSDVVRPYFNALDVVRRPRDMWIIDFGCEMPITDAAAYEMPFEYVKQVVKPVRDRGRNEREKDYWWLHRRPAPDMREAVTLLRRFITTPRVAKYRVFVWLNSDVIPDCQLYVFARDDDYFFGVLHSKPHEIWALRQGTSLEDRPRYTPTTTFETFPFPWPPGREPASDPRVEAIAAAAHDLVEKRDRWLNPEGASEAELKKRTLTNLYNARPEWLAIAHHRLDEAVLDAYGWPHDLTDEQILERLLALNLERAAAQGEAPASQAGEADDESGDDEDEPKKARRSTKTAARKRSK
jgi:type II restriction/modification system DNA methylase subunit YeeA